MSFVSRLKKRKKPSIVRLRFAQIENLLTPLLVDQLTIYGVIIQGHPQNDVFNL